MSLKDAQRKMYELQAIEALETAKIPPDVIKRVEGGLAAMEMINGATNMLRSVADETAARNYVSLQLVGVPLPFDRMFVELVRPGGKYASELVEDLKEDLRIVCQLVKNQKPSADVLAVVEAIEKAKNL